MDSFTIAHISDLHLSAEHKRFNLRRARRLLEEIGRRRVDHVVVTGDIAADADRREFEIARGLFRNSGLLDPAKLSLVIGNHDVFGVSSKSGVPQSDVYYGKRMFEDLETAAKAMREQDERKESIFRQSV